VPADGSLVSPHSPRRAHSRRRSRQLALCVAASMCAHYGQAGGVSAQAALDGRPLVLFVHGRAQQDKSNQQIESEWLAPFRRGLQAIGAGDLIRAEDTAFVFYQDIYRGTAPPEASLCPAYLADARARLEPLEVQHQASLANESRARAKVDSLASQIRVFSDQMTKKGGAAGLPVSEPEALDRIRDDLKEATDAFEGARAETSRANLALLDETRAIAAERAEREQQRRSIAADLFARVRAAIAKALANQVPKVNAAMAYLFPDTNRYVESNAYQCATDARLAEALVAAQSAKRPVVLVAHSMGTFVSYNMLFDDDRSTAARKARPFYDVAAFISLGSQLGVEPLIQAIVGQLKPAFPVPRSLRTWRNLRGEHDWVAPLPIRGSYEVKHLNPPYVEYELNTAAAKPHDIGEYLQHPATSRSILAAWCRAFVGAAPKPAACKNVVDLPSLTKLPAGTTQIWPKPE
jgi:hypothetical protein